MSFYEGLHAELTRDKGREPLAVRLLLGLFAFIDRVKGLGRRPRRS